MDLTGQRFGRLVAIERVADGVAPSGLKATRWLFQCDCGERVERRAGNVRGGTTLSCGCIKREQRAKGKAVVDYQGAHARVYRLRGKASRYPCIDCGHPAQDWSYDGTDPNALRGGPWNCLYSLSVEHYVARCKPCHALLDWSARRAS